MRARIDMTSNGTLRLALDGKHSSSRHNLPASVGLSLLDDLRAIEGQMLAAVTPDERILRGQE